MYFQKYSNNWKAKEKSPHASLFKEHVICCLVNIFSVMLQDREPYAAFKLRSLLVKIQFFLRLFKIRAYISHILLLSEVQNPILYCYARKC